MKRVVVSAVNFSEGGPLTILRSCLATARARLPKDCEIIALVHRKDLIAIDGIQLTAFPESKKSWLRRLKLEYWTFKALSTKLKPDFWLSLHDMSPRLNGERQAVYCHNPSPFFQPTWRDGWFEPTLIAFRLFYQFIYRFNIKSNDIVIVQQQWLRQEFERRYKAKRVMVAFPSTTDISPQKTTKHRDGKFIIFYPTIARAFKNIETLCRAIADIEQKSGGSIELRVTISGTENRYARYLNDQFRQISSIKFIGRQDREQMAQNYAACDLLAFPSRLETWGLPITEAKSFGLPIIAADLPYAHETVGSYDRVSFLPPLESDAWGAAFLAASQDQHVFQVAKASAPTEPFAQDWEELWDYLLDLSSKSSL